LGVQITDKTNLVYADTELYKEDVPFLIHYFIQAANRKTLQLTGYLAEYAKLY
jgi:hypothetical protein